MADMGKTGERMVLQGMTFHIQLNYTVWSMRRWTVIFAQRFIRLKITSDHSK